MGASKGAKALTGSEASDLYGIESLKPAPKPDRSRSQCWQFKQQIHAKIEQGLTAQRIYQDLVSDYGFMAKYHSVRRYVGALLESKELPVRRMEVAAGQEMQIDYGQGARCKDHTGQWRKTYVFRLVLPSVVE